MNPSSLHENEQIDYTEMNQSPHSGIPFTNNAIFNILGYQPPYVPTTTPTPTTNTTTTDGNILNGSTQVLNDVDENMNENENNGKENMKESGGYNSNINIINNSMNNIIEDDDITNEDDEDDDNYKRNSRRIIIPLRRSRRLKNTLSYCEDEEEEDPESFKIRFKKALTDLKAKYEGNCVHHPSGCVRVEDNKHFLLTEKLYKRWASLIVSGEDVFIDSLPVAEELAEFSINNAICI